MCRKQGSRNLDVRVQAAILAGRAQGISQVQLSVQFGVTPGAISQILKRCRMQGAVIAKKSPGRPCKTSKNMDRSILHASREDPRRTATAIYNMVSTPTDPAPSCRTIRRRLQAAGLNGRRSAKKKSRPAKKSKQSKLQTSPRELEEDDNE